MTSTGTFLFRLFMACHLWTAQGQTVQSLTWDSPPPNKPLLLNKSYPLAGMASSGLPVSFRVEVGPAAIMGNSVVVTNLGTIALVAEQAGNTDNRPVKEMRIFNRSRVDITVTWPDSGEFGPEAAVLAAGDWLYMPVSSELRGRPYANYPAKLEVLSITNKLNPRWIAEVTLDTNMIIRAFDAVGDLACLGYSPHIVGPEPNPGGLKLIDLSDDTRPNAIGSYSSPGWPYDLKIVANHVYVAASNLGLEIVDVTDRNNPKRVGGLITQGVATSVAVIGNLAYVGNSNGTLAIGDVSDPTNPVLLGTLNTGGSPWDVKVVGNLAYVANTGDLAVVDVANSANPILIKRVRTRGTARHLQSLRNRLYVGTYPLEVFDITEAASPVSVGATFSSIVYEMSLPTEGDYAYAIADSGLRVVRFAEAKLEQSVQFDLPLAVQVSNSPLKLTASASSGLPVTFSSLSGVASLAGDILTITEPNALVL